MNAIAINPLKHAPAGIPLPERAMLASVTVCQWSGRKLDKTATAETIAANRAESDAGRFNKQLVASGHIAAIAKISGKARNTFYHLTAPWLDIGGRILPAAGYDRFMAEMSGLRREFEKAVSAFVAAYPGMIEESRNRLGDMFHESDYPTAKEIARRFAFDIAILPLPAASDFRVGIPDSAAIQADIEQRTKSAIETAMRDTWERLAETVEHMAEKLRDYQPGGENGRATNVFRDSLVENIRDLVSILPGLNLTESPQLARISELVEAHLCQHDASVLRDDTAKRAQTARAAETIAKALSDFI